MVDGDGAIWPRAVLENLGKQGPGKIRRPGKILKLVWHGGRLAYDGFAQLARTRVSFLIL